MQQQTLSRERVLFHLQQAKDGESSIHPDLSGQDLTGCDLRGFDLCGVNLSRANLTNAQLDGARLQAAILTQACFAGVRVEALMAAGLAPRDLLAHRADANRLKFPALHFAPVVSPLTPLLLTARECSRICRALREHCWDQLTDEAIFTALYPDEPWDTWMAQCRTRLVLTWALEHRAFLNRTADRVPFYGRVLPSTLIDEVPETDLVAGSKTSPERVFHAIGIRQIVAQSDLQGSNVAYPSSPFGCWRMKMGTWLAA